MKKIKYLFLIVFIFLVSGCSVNWDDVTKEYGDILKQNPKCTYYGDENGVVDFNSLEFSASMDGIYAKYDGGTKTEIIGKSSFNNVHYINSRDYYYNDFDVESYFSNYKISNTCPKNIYVCNLSGVFYISDSKIVDGTCYTYKTKNSSNAVSPTDKMPCYLDTSISCHHYNTNDASNRNVYVEVGHEKTTDNPTAKYFVVSYDNFKTGDIAREKNGLSVMTSTGDTYIVFDESIYNKVDGKYPKINIPYTPSGGANQVYYIYNKESDAEFGDFEGSEVEDSKPTPQVDGNISNNEIVDISFCQGGVLRSFQIIGYIIFIIKIVIPLILIILGSIDFAKGIMGGEKANKETISAFVRRIIAAVIVFLIPTVLNFIIGLIDGAEDVADDFSSCGHCLFDPLGDDCDAKAIGE